MAAFDLKKKIEKDNKSTTKMFGKSSVQPYYTPKDSSDTTLVFESRFESGNLNLAI
jgi:hypothetical protein